MSQYRVLVLWSLLVVVFGSGSFYARGIARFFFLFCLLFIVSFPFLTILVRGRLWLGAVLLAATFNSTVAVGEVFWRERLWVGTWMFYRIQAVCMGVIFAFYLALFLNARERWWKEIARSAGRALVYAMAIFVLLALFGLVVGLIHGNNPTYLVGDTFRLVAVPLAFLCAFIGARGNHAFELLKAVAGIVFLFLVMHGVIALYYFAQTGYLAAGIGGYMMMLPTVFLFSSFLLRKHSVRMLVCLLIAITVIALSLKRAVWVETLACAMLVLMLNRQRLSLRLLGRVAMVGVCCIVLVISANPTAVTAIVQTIQARLTHTFMHWQTDSYRSREVEAAVRELHGRSPPLGPFLGAGSGAQFRMLGEGVGVDPATLSLAPDLHTIHFTPGAVYFRHGVLGLFLFLGALALIFRALWRRNIGASMDAHHAIISQTSLLYVSAILLNSLVAFSIIGDINLGLALGIFASAFKSSEPLESAEP